MLNKTEQEIMKNWKGDKTKPLVSICTITYNHEKFISDAIDSFLLQETNFSFEIIIGEDCSSDNTKKIIEKYIEKYPNIIKLIMSESNVGIQKNFERTLSNCRAEYIAICEGDDYWTNDKKLQIQISQMRKNKDLGISFHLAARLENNNLKNPYLKESNKIYTIQEIIQEDFHLVQTNTIMLKKDYLNNLSYELLFKSPVSDVWLRIACSMPNGALFINEIMSVYRVQSEGSWSQSMQKNNKFMIFVNKMMRSVDDFDEYWKYKYTKEFNTYKNMYIRVVMSKNILKEQKNNFMEEYRDIISLKNKILWNFLYKNQNIVHFLKKMKLFISKVN